MRSPPAPRIINLTNLTSPNPFNYISPPPPLPWILCKVRSCTNRSDREREREREREKEREWWVRMGVPYCFLGQNLRNIAQRTIRIHLPLPTILYKAIIYKTLSSLTSFFEIGCPMHPLCILFLLCAGWDILHPCFTYFILCGGGAALPIMNFILFSLYGASPCTSFN